MDPLNNAPDAGGGEAVPAVTPAADIPASLTPSEAARILNSQRYKAQEGNKDDNGADPAAGQSAQVSADEADGAQPQADPAEATNEADPAETPTIEPPRSWTKEEKEAFKLLPPEHQQRISDRERTRETEFRRSQNEAAEQRKAIEAERGKVEQARQQYEAALPALLNTLQQQQVGEFSDIKSMADVEKLAAEDPFRFSLWQAQQMKIAAVRQEVQQTQERQAQETQQSWAKFSSEQDQLAQEKIPDLADKAKAAKLADTSLNYLKEIGFKQDELVANWNGQEKISLRDARMQKLVHDAARYQELKSKPPAPATKPVPQVVRPGVSQPRGASDDTQIQALQSRFERTGSAKDAAALLTARRIARAS